MREQVKKERQECAVRGVIQPGAMCGEIITGGRYCGHEGSCIHKIEMMPLPAAPKPAAEKGGE